MEIGREKRVRNNACLTMHQPWASLLVYGIKRIEGRSWPAPIRGRLWIHAAGKVPDPATIKAMEDFYREIYAVDGITDLKFPEHYPVSRLLGCVEVVGCLKCEELVGWEELPGGVRLEGQTDFCWLCEQPQRLLIPFEMRGYQGVYNLEKRIYEAAVRGLRPVESPLPVKFPLPEPSDPFSLKPGSLLSLMSSSKASQDNSSNLDAAIAGARAAAKQFSKKEQKKSNTRYETNLVQGRNIHELLETTQSNNIVTVADDKEHSHLSDGRRTRGGIGNKYVERNYHASDQGPGTRPNPGLQKKTNQQTGASSKIFAAAVKGLQPP